MMYSDYVLISALLKGDAKMSAETRLRIWNSNNNTDRDAHDIVANTEIRENMMEVVKIAAEGVALQDIRTNYDNMSLFKTFVNLCLIHFTTSISWRYKACDSVISDIFTVTDEALCILFLENNADDYVRVYQEKKKIDRKESRPKYTKVDNVQKKFKGWDRKAIKRFNEIVMCVKRNRDSSESKKIEEELRLRYKQIAGRDGDCLDGRIGNDDSDESENEELYAYDGFAGDVQNIQQVATNLTQV